ncbi:MAG: acetylornithine/succinylornithine family transaminase [Phycisphaerae bacterium]|nr:acetylornithine/succinylornithine family transaminase [Phycisphaerae bacterium]
MATQAEIIETTSRYLMNNYGRPLLAVARGRGSRVWDADGREYIDLFAGFGGGGVAGHCHPKIAAAIKKQAETLLSHGNFFTNAPQVQLAKAITSHAFGGKVFFCHSGAEANEAALKLVRLATGDGRYKIISFHNCFHGRTMGALSLTPQSKQKGFEPMLPGNIMVDYGDLAGVAAAVDDETAGVFVEPIQGEGGVNIPTKEFMQGLRKLCDQKELVLVCDEVWTAPARTGKWFAYQHYGIEPDVMTLAKALGGGAPVAACVASSKYAEVLGPATHASTMGGNPLCAAAGAATMKLIDDEHLVDRAAEKGKETMQAIRDAKIPCVKEVRGAGMMIGIEVDKAARDVFLACMDAGLLVCYAHEHVVRLAPPLIVSDADLSQGLKILCKVLRA